MGVSPLSGMVPLRHNRVMGDKSVGSGAPEIIGLKSEQLDELERIAMAAPVSTEMGAVDSDSGQPLAELAVTLFRMLVEQSPDRPCWMVFDTRPGEAAVITALTGNGPSSEAAARLYALSRDAILVLVRHARLQQREIDRLTNQGGQN